MQIHKPSWEGTALLFLILFTIGLGVAYNVGYVYRFAVPWFWMLLASAAIAGGIHFYKYRRWRQTKEDRHA